MGSASLILYNLQYKTSPGDFFDLFFCRNLSPAGWGEGASSLSSLVSSWSRLGFRLGLVVVWPCVGLGLVFVLVLVSSLSSLLLSWSGLGFGLGVSERMCVYVCVRERVCVLERERARGSVCVSERESLCFREDVCVCVCHRERESMCVSEREGERVCVCVRESVCV